MNKSAKILLVSFLFLPGTSLPLVGQMISLKELPKARLDIAVVDESDSPVNGADVEITDIFQPDWRVEPALQSAPPQKTNQDGFASATLPSGGSLTFKVSKEDYYDAEGKYDYQELGKAGWKPESGTVKAVLRKIGRPVPMYARVVSVDLDARECPRGIDLTTGDVGPPEHGEGLLQITIEKPIGDRKHVEETLSFPNDGDGIKPYMHESYGFKDYLFKYSAFKFPHNADYDPEYKRKITFAYDEIEGRLKPSPDQMAVDGYIFRIGRHYGKVYGPIIVLPRISNPDEPLIHVEFAYTLNVKEEESSLEWNMENKCIDAQWIATPQEP